MLKILGKIKRVRPSIVRYCFVLVPWVLVSCHEEGRERLEKVIEAPTEGDSSALPDSGEAHRAAKRPDGLGVEPGGGVKGRQFGDMGEPSTLPVRSEAGRVAKRSDGLDVEADGGVQRRQTGDSGEPSTLPVRSEAHRVAKRTDGLEVELGGGVEGRQAGGAVEPSPEARGDIVKSTGEAVELAACPDGMIYIDVESCSEVEEVCAVYSENSMRNRPPICAGYEKTRKCVGEWRRLRFCMDKYEYPNQKGAHPPVMVDAWSATAICHSEGKRLCWEREWTAACEGSRQEPYPYGGYKRDPAKCRVDQPWVQPRPEKMISRIPVVRDHEMRRLDQSLPSGAMSGCKSEAGVYDLTGNFDEWVYIERPHRKAKWAGLKGGHWLKVRNTCRPVTTNHPEGFMFYAVSFRCCRDAEVEARAATLPKGSSPLWEAPRVPQKRARGELKRGWSPDFESYKKYEVFNEKRLRGIRESRRRRSEREAIERK